MCSINPALKNLITDVIPRGLTEFPKATFPSTWVVGRAVPGLVQGSPSLPRAPGVGSFIPDNAAFGLGCCRHAPQCERRWLERGGPAQRPPTSPSPTLLPPPSLRSAEFGQPRPSPSDGAALSRWSWSQRSPSRTSPHLWVRHPGRLLPAGSYS